MVSGEIPASNRTHEESLLALCLRSEGAIHEAMELGVRSALFHDRGHRRLWDGFLEDLRDGYSPDEGTLLDRHGADVGAGRPPGRRAPGRGIPLQGSPLALGSRFWFDARPSGGAAAPRASGAERGVS